MTEGSAVCRPQAMENDVPEILEAALRMLALELDRVMSNITQELYDNPFQNSGGSYRNEVFEATAYDWSDGSPQWYNFAWRDLRVCWYKYLGRGMTANMDVTPEMASACLSECLASLRRIEDEHDAALAEQDRREAAESIASTVAGDAPDMVREDGQAAEGERRGA